MANKPDIEKAKEAVRTLIKFTGDDPERNELKNTPDRVVKSFSEFFSGYDHNLEDLFEKKFTEHGGYKGIISLKDIEFESYCEHHFVPIIGRATVAYLPKNEVIGISKLARIVKFFAKRLQLQERMTVQIANAIQENLSPEGVAVLIEAEHQCLSTRGVLIKNSKMQTMSFTGVFEKDQFLQGQFLSLTK